MTVHVSGKWYNIEVDRERLSVTLSSGSERFYYILSLLSGCDRTRRPDQFLRLGPIRKSVKDGVTTIRVSERNSAWKRKEYVFECHPAFLLAYYTVEGNGTIEHAKFFSGRKNSQAVGSAPGFNTVFCAAPNFDDKEMYGACETAFIGIGENETWRANAFAGGSPFCFGLKHSSDRHWVSVGVAARAGEYLFDSFTFNPVHDESEVKDTLGPGGFSLDYHGKLKVRGKWRSPGLVFLRADDEYDCIKRYTRWLKREGYLPRIRKKVPAWWKEPIFCGWREQIASALLRQRRERVTDECQGASDFCTQQCYERWLGNLERNGIIPGTIIIDAHWQSHNDYSEVNEQKWPDLRGFIDARHDKGQHVLLWQGTWSKSAALSSECITCKGKPVNVDPSNPKFEKKLRACIRRMISGEPGCYNADGFKIDGTGRIPVGPDLKSFGDLWGLELQKKYIRIYYEEAKKHKPDALISIFIANAYLEELADHVRLGDMYTVMGDPTWSMHHRAAVLRATYENPLVDTDGQHYFDVRKQWFESFEEQCGAGIPCLYNADYSYRARNFRPVEIDRYTKEQYARIRERFESYRKQINDG